MVVTVNQPDVVVGGDVDAVWISRERPLSPGADEVAISIPDGQGVKAAAEYVHLIVRVHGAVRGRSELPVLGHVWPLGYALISKVARSYHCHRGSPLLLNSSESTAIVFWASVPGQPDVWPRVQTQNGTAST